ncbi:MAG: sulfatase [Planctomycetaceae bacterium]|jgi:arylsulfatase A-like enzyme|nr:sulfatase [Planctomycetaceae bacterium]
MKLVRIFSLFLLLILRLPFDILAAQIEKDERFDDRPNILICMADDASYPYFGANGNTWVKTPGFDRVAREGIRFTHAYTPNAKCAPSRSCILTGRNPWQLEEAANHIPYFPAKFMTYPESLAKHGYFVGMTQKGWAPGVAKDKEGNDRQMAGIPFNNRTLKPPTSGISRNDYAGNFEDFLNAKPKDKPWCFWYGSVEPHRSYEYGTGVSLGKKTLDVIDRVPAYLPDNEIVRNDLLDHAFEIEYFDKQIILMLENLEKRGELDNTIVIVTADNGMPFPRSKGQSYEISCHLPFAVMWKGGIKNQGRVVDDYVSFIDVAPTLLELAQVSQEESGLQPISGKSLAPIFSSSKNGIVVPSRNYVLLGRERNDVGRPHDEGYPIRALVKEEFLYLHNFDPERWPGCNPETGYMDVDGGPSKTEILNARRNGGEKKYWDLSFAKRPQEELYDLRNDPDCLNNLSKELQYQERLKSLKEDLFAQLKAQQDPRILGNGTIFDQYVHASGNRNYYERVQKGENVKAGWITPTDIEKEKIE